MTSVSNSSDGTEERPVVSEWQQPGTSGAPDESGRLPERKPSIREAPVRFHGKALQADHIRLVLFPEAIEEIARHAESDTDREVGGVLLGVAYRHAGKAFVDVRRALPARSSDHGPIHFTFNADAWSQIHRDRAAQYPGLDIVGWFHTHPGLGIFFSADDVVVHSAAFVLPWHAALVVDPVTRRTGSFAWRKGALEALPGFYEIRSDAMSESMLPWRLQKGEIWTESYMERLAMQHRRQSQQQPAKNVSRAWYARLAAGLVSLLVLGLFIVALVTLRNQNNTLRTLVTSLAHQNIQEANARGAASCPDSSLRIFAPLPDGQLAFGQEVTLVGTADVAAAASYRLDIRPSGEQTWWSLGSFRRPTQAGQFLTWDTASFPPGAYDLRLLAIDTAGTALRQPAPCTIRFEIMNGAPN